MKNDSRGFTIVELLVVIVVIAILAAMAIMSYNGINDRAYNTQTIAAADGAVKIISLAYTGQGQMTLRNGVPNGGSELCIGNPADFPAKASLQAGQCAYTGTGSYTSSELWDILKQYGNANLNTPLFDDGSGNDMRGITYLLWRYKSSPTFYGFLTYSLKGRDQNCAVSGAERSDNIQDVVDGARETSCWINLTKLLGADPIVY